MAAEESEEPGIGQTQGLYLKLTCVKESIHTYVMQYLIVYKYYFITFGAFLTTIACSAQASQNYDRDIRIKSMPSLPGIANFMESCGLQGNVKWYKEIGADGVFYEGKTKYNGVLYSVEFDTLGEVKDVEKTVSFETLPLHVYEEIQAYLSEQFTKFWIKETQLQWSGDNAVLIALIQQGKSALPHITHYELIVKGKLNAGRKHYELVFDDHGKLIERSEIPLRNTDHLDF